MAFAICSGVAFGAVLASVTVETSVGKAEKGGAPLYPDASSGSIRNLKERPMADATTAARTRIDRALAELERKILELKARPASAPAIADDDLFAPRGDAARVAELEAAGREASDALARAAEAVRGVLAQSEAG
jgi:hypothetical protein